MALHVTLNLRKAGLSGLFLLGFTALAVAEPLKLEIQEANVERDQRNGEPVVSLTLTKESQQAFGSLTQRYVGKPLELRVESRVIMAPVVIEPILGGPVVISGTNLTVEQTNELARKIQAGAVVEVEVPEAFR